MVEDSGLVEYDMVSPGDYGVMIQNDAFIFMCNNPECHNLKIFLVIRFRKVSTENS